MARASGGLSAPPNSVIPANSVMPPSSGPPPSSGAAAHIGRAGQLGHAAQLGPAAHIGRAGQVGHATQLRHLGWPGWCGSDGLPSVCGDQLVAEARQQLTGLGRRHDFDGTAEGGELAGDHLDPLPAHGDRDAVARLARADSQLPLKEP